jgi:arylsulfatase A-like enzyme
MPPNFIKNSSDAGLRGDMIALFDWLVGQVDETLQRLGLAKNTLLIITSDNGAQLTDFYGNSWGHKPNGVLRGQKADIWDGGHREPFVVRWPDVVAPGSHSDQLICLGDLLATCAGITHVELPEGAGPDSQSILPVLYGEEGPVRETLVHHSADGMFSIRQGQWKLIEGLGSGGFSEPARVKPDHDGPTGQLYNIAQDIVEQNNLWQDKPQIVAEMRALLEEIIAASKIDLPLL